MSLEDVCKMLDGKAAVPLWPEAGRALDLKRGATYAAAAAGQIKTLQFGRLQEGADRMAEAEARFRACGVSPIIFINRIDRRLARKMPGRTDMRLRQKRIAYAKFNTRPPRRQ